MASDDFAIAVRERLSIPQRQKSRSKDGFSEGEINYLNEARAAGGNIAAIARVLGADYTQVYGFYHGTYKTANHKAKSNSVHKSSEPSANGSPLPLPQPQTIEKVEAVPVLDLATEYNRSGAFARIYGDIRLFRALVELAKRRDHSTLLKLIGNNGVEEKLIRITALSQLAHMRSTVAKDLERYSVALEAQCPAFYIEQKPRLDEMKKGLEAEL